MNIEEAAEKVQLSKMPADSHCREPYWTATDDELQRLAKILRNQTLEDAAKEAEHWQRLSATPGHVCGQYIGSAILAMKEQT